ncbi:hypothetical protein BKA70DRAFT_11429 [Coprinopsis sp. MPI-PUGE-AT-0042]|nr:hypothetical protein BKA70DRAFT_11429 [Coprinopsis sp. MPI-PUGE-AT-0042]
MADDSGDKPAAHKTLAPLTASESHHSSATATSEVQSVADAPADTPTYPQANLDKESHSNVEIPLGPVTFVVRGALNLQTIWLDAKVSVRIPLVGTFALGEVHGHPETGLKLGFSPLGDTLAGRFHFFIKGQWLYADLAATIFKKDYGPVTVSLIPIFFRTDAATSKFPWNGFIQWVNNPDPVQKSSAKRAIIALMITQDYGFTDEDYKEKGPDGVEREYNKWNFGPKEGMALDLASEADEKGVKTVPPEVADEWESAVANAGKYAKDEGLRNTLQLRPSTYTSKVVSKL